MKRFLIVCLGNIGPEYVDTRHNIGFMAGNAMAELAGVPFKSCRYGDMAIMKVKNCELMLLKPSTFMNLSGVAVRFWMNKEKLPLENLLVIVDDIALPFGAVRLRKQGSDAGHNGLKNIASELGTQQYARLRVGVGNDFPRGSLSSQSAYQWMRAFCSRWCRYGHRHPRPAHADPVDVPYIPYRRYRL